MSKHGKNSVWFTVHVGYLSSTEEGYPIEESHQSARIEVQSNGFPSAEWSPSDCSEECVRSLKAILKTMDRRQRAIEETK